MPASGPAFRPSGSSRHSAAFRPTDRSAPSGGQPSKRGARARMTQIERPAESAVRNVRVAVVGCGYWGKNLVRNFAELGALEALVDAHQPSVDALIAKHGGRSLSFSAALADPAIEAVAIAAPAALHFALTKQAIEAGNHVFVEKP